MSEAKFAVMRFVVVDWWIGVDATAEVLPGGFGFLISVRH